MPYAVVIENNCVVDVQHTSDADYDELGVEWAISELRDTFRHSKIVSATFSLGNDAELQEFLAQVQALLGPDAVGSEYSGSKKT